MQYDKVKSVPTWAFRKAQTQTRVEEGRSSTFGPTATEK